MKEGIDLQERLLMAFNRYLLLIGAAQPTNDADSELKEQIRQDKENFHYMVMKFKKAPFFSDDDCKVFMTDVMSKENEPFNSDICEGFILGYHAAKDFFLEDSED